MAKINEKTGLPFRSDRELVATYQQHKLIYEELFSKDDLEEKRKALIAQQTAMRAAYELWDKYFLLRRKMEGELRSVVNRTEGMRMPEVKEEYDSRAWEKFIHQMDGIRLEDVAHHGEKWGIYIRLWGYWRSMNRDWLKEWFDWNGNTCPIKASNKNGEEYRELANIDIEAAKHWESAADATERSFSQRIFNEAFVELGKELTDKEKHLINMRANGMQKNAILQKLQITSKIMNQSLDRMKKRLGELMVDVSKKHGSPMKYDEVVRALGGM